MYVAMHSLAELQAKGVVYQLIFQLGAKPSFCCGPITLTLRTPAAIPIRLHIMLFVSSKSPSLCVGHVSQLPTPIASVYAHHPTWAIGPFTVSVVVGTGQGQI